jgi:lysophospholipase L1-like esterase
MQSQPVPGTDELGLEVEDDDEFPDPVPLDEDLAAELPDDDDLAPPGALVVDEDFPTPADPLARAAVATGNALPPTAAPLDLEPDRPRDATEPRAEPAPRVAPVAPTADGPSASSEVIATAPPIAEVVPGTDRAPSAAAATTTVSAPVAAAAPIADVAPAADVAPIAEIAPDVAAVPEAVPEGTAAAPAPVAKGKQGARDPDDDPSVMIPFDLEEDAPKPFEDEPSEEPPPHSAEAPRAGRPTTPTPSKPAAPVPTSSNAPRPPAPTMKSLARRTGPTGTPAPAPTAPQKPTAAPAAKSVPGTTPTPAAKTAPAGTTGPAARTTPTAPTPAAKSSSAAPPPSKAPSTSSPPRAPSRPSVARSPSGILAAMPGDDPLTARFAWLAGQRHPPALDDVRRLVADYRSLTWVFTGDGVTQGGRFTRDRKSFTELFSERIRWELKRFQDVVVNTGMDGERVAGLAKRLDWRVLRFRPDVVGVQIGLQDALTGRAGRGPFRDALREVVERIRAEGAIVLLQTPTLFRHKDVPGWGDLPRYVDAIRDVAASTGSPLVDHWSHWERLSAARHAVPLLSEDGLHPGRRGHRELARLLFAVLDVLDPHSPMCADD